MANQAPPSGTFQITLQRFSTAAEVFDVSGNDTIAMLKDAIQARTGISRLTQRLVFSGKQLTEEDKTLSECEIGPGSVIQLLPALRKPVVYLYPPEPTQVSVKLSLIPEWRFSVLYPYAPVEDIKQSEGQRLGQRTEWNVLARPDGTMTVITGDHAGVDAAYLFWEAQIAEEAMEFPDSPPSSRPASPAINRELAFIPGKSICAPSDSVLIRAKDVPTYLDKALQALTLHAEARTSFITFWLPSLLRHQFVALKFIPQASFERAAPLDITPLPDAVTRIFMLFQGVKASEVSSWQSAVSRASESPEVWRQVVGVEDKEAEGNLFRVVEWGGMEVL
ncbi:hypothetical protein M407DRAFT_18935 [Tulasnella calospora MUT 4182]|uniref:Ubiquitin-like domain-containing protein n=1 Tax=Tulasnella calospora MUT 4182 TaxID=1051891 RepID=A0A0C3QIY2_9AGAM|nr:hypothetical protein M407DRAFT_18935 [Tulasnella calospora MUT 4182]